jgi:hypothetical protein
VHFIPSKVENYVQSGAYAIAQPLAVRHGHAAAADAIDTFTLRISLSLAGKTAVKNATD